MNGFKESSHTPRKRDGVYVPPPLSDYQRKPNTLTPLTPSNTEEEDPKPFSEKIPLDLTGRDAKLAWWSEQVKIRDGHICTHPSCGETERRLLQSHHIESKHLFPHLQYEIDNGETLCMWHHAHRHADKEGLFNMMLANLCKIYYEILHPKAA